jgi:hypothetical protein
MKRNMSSVTGILATLAALILIVSGCTTNNPVSPAIDSNDFSDVMTGEEVDKLLPEIVAFDRDDPYTPDPGDQTGEAMDLDADIRR